MLVLKNCKFVPFLTEGVDFETGDVFVENGRIEKILPAGSECQLSCMIPAGSSA